MEVAVVTLKVTNAEAVQMSVNNGRSQNYNNLIMYFATLIGYPIICSTDVAVLSLTHDNTLSHIYKI